MRENARHRYAVPSHSTGDESVQGAKRLRSGLLSFEIPHEHHAQILLVLPFYMSPLQRRRSAFQIRPAGSMMKWYPMSAQPWPTWLLRMLTSIRAASACVRMCVDAIALWCTVMRLITAIGSASL